MQGVLRKMNVQLEEEVQYHMVLSGNEIGMNQFLDKHIKLVWSGIIFCSACGNKTKTSFGEGFCYPCFQSAPEATECTIRPELCRAHLGEGRDPDWEERNHNQPHIVYLAASDIVKVGVTRKTQVPTRWIDQGASAAIRLAETPNRYEAGKLEVALKSFFADKTNWQRMLKNMVDDSIDLEHEKWALHDELPEDLTMYFTEDDEIINIQYPVIKYPSKVKSLSFDKMEVVEGKLVGIKGQYLLFDDDRVFNVRKHTSYEIELISE
jgi:hypothetical protein